MTPDKELSEHFETLRNDIAGLAESIAQLVSDSAGVQASLKKRVAAMSSDALEAASKQTSAMVSSVEGGIKHNPVMAVVTALGLGLAIGLMTRR